MRALGPIASVLFLAVLAGAARGAETKLLTAQAASGEIAGWKWFSEDPAVKVGDVWRLADGVLRCKGKPNGYLYTEKSYTNFTLKLQWRAPRESKPGRGGVLIRMTGEHRIWPKSLEAQLNAGDEGDFWGLAGYSLQGPADRTKALDHPQFGKLTNVKKAPAAVKPAGLWNAYEIVAKDGAVTLKINGQVVNEATGCEVSAGPILLTSEGDPIEFRDITIAE